MRAEALTPSIPPKYKSLWLRPASLHPVGARKAGRRAPHGRAVRRPLPDRGLLPGQTPPAARESGCPESPGLRLNPRFPLRVISARGPLAREHVPVVEVHRPLDGLITSTIAATARRGMGVSATRDGVDRAVAVPLRDEADAGGVTDPGCDERADFRLAQALSVVKRGRGEPGRWPLALERLGGEVRAPRRRQ